MAVLHKGSTMLTSILRTDNNAKEGSEFVTVERIALGKNANNAEPEVSMSMVSSSLIMNRLYVLPRLLPAKNNHLKLSDK